MISYAEFENKYLFDIIINRGSQRAGQALMNFLWKTRPQKYHDISTNIPELKQFDCFYNDDIIPLTLEHLKLTWDKKLDT